MMVEWILILTAGGALQCILLQLQDTVSEPM